ncbi:Nn.00g092850.m01.CDS01 [Neocucurbitaria sp. VM-36]
MPSITLYPPSKSASTASPTENPLPALLHTPSGLALLEVQGTIHFPAATSSSQTSTQVGKLVFPLYDPSNDPSDTKWMKRVYLYVGKGQRMTGECKKLGKPVGVIRKRRGEMGRTANGETMGEADVEMGGVDGQGEQRVTEEELEIVEVVRYRIVFSARPEPISGVQEMG